MTEPAISADPGSDRNPGPVIVVGAGAAGLTAALTAAQAGSPVTIYEAAPQIKGSSGRAVGSITASRTEQQAAVGIADAARDHLEDLLAGQDEEARVLGHELLAAIAHDSGTAVDWLSRLGVEFSGPHPEPPHRVPRMHCAMPSGQALLDRLVTEAARLGVEIKTATPVIELLFTDQAAVAGVLLADGTRHTARAVVLAAGDASSAFAGRDPSHPPGINPYAGGDGLHLAETAGGRVHTPWASRQIRSLDPPHYHPDRDFFARGVVAVTCAGEFLTTEHEALTEMLGAGEQAAYLIFDRRVADQIAVAAEDSPGCRDGWTRPGRCFISTFPGIAYAYLEDLLERGLAQRADSLSQLARGLGLPSQELAVYAAAPFGLGEGELYALGPIVARTVLSDGGVETDPRGRVLAAAGRPIPGLMAAGSTAWGGFRTRGHGVHLGWAVVSGRRAGAAAAAGV